MEEKITLKIKKKEITWLLALYILITLYLLYFSPLCGRSKPHRSIQPIPFRTIGEQLTMPHGPDIFLGNLVGNIIVLLPGGFLAALLGWKPKLIRALLIFLGVAFSIELLQYLYWVGCMDIDDIWMNAAGGLLGFWMGCRIRAD